MFKKRFLLICAAISLIAATAAISHPFPNASASTQPASSSIGSPAFYEYRRGEWSPNAAVASSIGGAAFYEYRQGEWSINLNPQRDVSNSAFRQGERTANLSPDLHDFANYQHRQGEWFGK